jgi:hypothetical protein
VGAGSLWHFAVSSILVNYISNPKGGGYNIALWDCPKLELFFLVMGKSMVKEKELNFGGPHN